jgi:rod shape-determining protein MreD
MNMRIAVGCMFLLFIIETTIVPWLVPIEWYGRVVPHFAFIFVLYSALYTGRHAALVLGLSFGLLQDIVFYGHMLGVHTFAMGLCGYATGLLLERKRSPLLLALSVIGLASLLYDSVVYLIYRAFRVTSETYSYVLMDSILPSLFLQLGFALAVYIPARKLLEGAAKPVSEDEE